MKTEAQIKETLQSLVGKTVEFLPDIERGEYSFEQGMRARVVKYDAREFNEDPRESIIKIWFDFGSYAEYNRPKQSANFYNKDGVPCLTWEQYAIEEFNSKEKKTYFSNDFEEMFKVVGMSEQEAIERIGNILFGYMREDHEEIRAAKGILENRKEILAILNEIA